MPKFSKASYTRLQTVDSQLQVLFHTVVSDYDCTVLEGRRGQVRQNRLFTSGKSKVTWPNSKHNAENGDLAKAVDVAPYIRGVSFERYQCYHFAGYVLAIARMLHIDIRWGGDWDRDKDINDQSFNDLCHFELED